jgi:protein TonB
MSKLRALALLVLPLGCAGKSVEPESPTADEVTDESSGSETEAPPSGDVDVRKLDEVMAQATYSPNPDPQALQQTKAARFDRTDGINITAFCVDVHGVVIEVETKQKFPDDPQVDRILRDTIASWRFKPFMVDGKPIKTCTERSFKLQFR